MKDNSPPTTGYIYFGIITKDESIGIEDINKYLSIKPTRFEKINSRGQIPKSTNWIFSSGDLYNPHYGEEIEALITKLEPFKDELHDLKDKLSQLVYVFRVIMYLGDETPALFFSKTVLSFLNEFNIEIDCDIYNSK